MSVQREASYRFFSCGFFYYGKQYSYNSYLLCILPFVKGDKQKSSSTCNSFGFDRNCGILSSNKTFELFSLAKSYSMETDIANKQILLAVGKTMLLSWQYHGGTYFQ
ncbi:MAG TPA: hypothetical protein PK771_06730 [Spirochaetota bacterium]|nr:hypothetical protein [Spirochaetota bacterium]